MNEITFAFTDDWLYEDETIHPKHISKVIPEWYKSTPNNISSQNTFKYLSKKRTVKSCSSFINVFNNGYIVFSPCDIILKYSKDQNIYNWETSYAWRTMFPDQENISFHDNSQMIDYLPKKAEDQFVFKINLPLTIFTNKDYKTIQQSVPYSYNNDWYVPYGIFDTDKIHELNLQIIITTNEKEILIKKGTPLAHYMPIKKEKTVLKVVQINKNNNLIKRFKKYYVSLNGKFKNTAFKLEGTQHG